MLARLYISNYALIQELQVDFSRNLNTVTGETGAGKSIILGALGLIIGNRADLSVLKEKEEKCVVEGQFEVKNYQLKAFFEENDLDYDDLTILRREITPAGKSRAFINDTPVNLKTLRDLGLKLIDIHSQHQNLELGNQKFQLDLVDAVAGAGEALEAYKKQFRLYRKTAKELAALKEQAEKEQADLDYYQFQFNQLEEAALKENEQEELEEELERLTHAEEIKTGFTTVVQLLDDERFSVIQNVKDGRKALEKIRNYMAEAAGLESRLESVMLELRDIADEADTLAEKIEHDPARIQEVNDRLNLIYSLLQKHNADNVAALIELRNELDQKISKVTGYDDEIRGKENELAGHSKILEEKAAMLSSIRKKAFPVIEKSVVEDLQQLGMSKIRFVVEHSLMADFGSEGKDEVAFLFSANADSAPDEISRIASGGEMSRLMLAIKNLLRSSKALPTIIFDEIDSGISGEVAMKMGTIIKSFSSTTQIINITHLPQIAARGDAHFRVYKLEENDRTITSIKQLTENERIEELAKMVGGDKLTDTTISAARELLAN
ncbi:DNA repair protein RecN [Maribellus luteus]|uniref:DNA repair protein RecN n=1 Tax=Maribellus luteus TaxID=2305463 RepID=A0A399SVF6_9BACT|nr:DNA repair protein RecN [Maribellus luteus]RIJ46714.1 DNA repair protein RecN [Maribellus luteus]